MPLSNPVDGELVDELAVHLCLPVHEVSLCPSRAWV